MCKRGYRTYAAFMGCSFLSFAVVFALGCGDDDSTVTPSADAGVEDTSSEDTSSEDTTDDASPLDATSDAGADVAPSCGDGRCNGDETCESCAGDCGSCAGLYVVEGEHFDATSTSIVTTEGDLMVTASGGAAAELSQTNAHYTVRTQAGLNTLCLRLAGSGGNPQIRVGGATIAVEDESTWTWVCVDHHAETRRDTVTIRWWNHRIFIDKLVIRQGGGLPEGQGPDESELCGDVVCQVHEADGACGDCDAPSCGDGSCQVGEDCSSCADDCGGCSSVYSGLCRTPEQLAALPAGYWCMVPDSHADQVEKASADWPDYDGSASASYDSYHRVVGFRAIAGAWGGAALDSTRDRLVLFGGGHNDYGGNELIAFDLATLAWRRLTDPTAFPNRAPETVNPDGTPLSRHSYNGLAYIAHADRFFALGGAPDSGPGGCSAPGSWVFDFTALESTGAYDPSQWSLRSGDGEPRTGCEDGAIYDPGGQRVLFHSSGGWWSYLFDRDAWSQISSDGRQAHASAAIAGRTLVQVGGGTDGVLTYDLESPALTLTELTTTGAKEIESVNNPGVAYDSVADRIVAWSGGADVYLLDLATAEWTLQAAPADNGADPGPVGASGGAYGRFRYSTRLNAHVTVDSTRENVFLLRLAQ